ncbi:MAG: DUF1858 domain-containing protein [Candidatus Micrarchaeia archaeon]
MNTRKKTIKVPIIKPKAKADGKVEYAPIEVDASNMPKRIEKIDKNTLIAEIIVDYPELMQMLIDEGLHCIGCPASSFEGIGDGCAVHGMDEKQTDALIEKLNLKIVELNKQKKILGKK